MQKTLLELLGDRKPLEKVKHESLRGEKEVYNIEELIGCGGNSLIYRATGSIDGKEYIIKETYPNIPGLTRDEMGNVKNTFDKAQKQFENIIKRAEREQDKIKTLTGKEGQYTDYVEWEIESFKANETFYAVGKYSGYRPMPESSLDLLSALHFIRRIIFALESIHEVGILHLDISPGNIIQTNMEKDEPAPVLKIIDFGSAYAIEEILNGDITPEFTRSGDFTAPELRGNIDIRKIGYEADVYSIGKVFCYLLGIERSDGEDRIIGRDDECGVGANQAIILLANELINKALHPSPAERYNSVTEMKLIVDEAIAKAKEPFLMNTPNLSAIAFYGRTEKLAEIDERLQVESYVFLEGMGGIGKSALARKYPCTDVYNNKYDNVQLIQYDGVSLKSTIISNLKFHGINENTYYENPYATKEEAEQQIYEEKILTLSKCSERTLIIIDNFNVNYDNNLRDLTNLKCKIVITTRNQQDNSIKIERMNDDDTLALFFGCYPKHKGHSSDDDQVVRNIIELVNGHTMTVELIAKTLKNSRISLQEMYDKLKLNFDTNIRETVKFEKDEKTNMNVMYAHILTVFNMADLLKDENIINIMLNMSLIPYTGVKTKLFRDLNGLKDFNDINVLIESGWLREDNKIISEFDDWLWLENENNDNEKNNDYEEAFISLHPVISAVVENTLKPDENTCSKMINGLIEHALKNNKKRFMRYFTKIFHFGNESELDLSNCLRLKNVIIPNTVTSIGDDIFSFCLNIENITIPKSVSTIGKRAFAGCRKINFLINDNLHFSTDGKIIYDREETTIVSFPSASGKIIIPSSVTLIEDGAFYNCYDLLSVCFSGDISLGDYAFRNCTSLENIVFLEPIKRIGTKNNYTINSLKTPLPDKLSPDMTTYHTDTPTYHFVTILNPETGAYNVFIPDLLIFAEGEKKTDVIESAMDIFKRFFELQYKYQKPVPGPTPQVEITDKWNGYEIASISIDIPSNVLLYLDPFYSCDNLRNITIPESVNEIAEGMFSGIPNSTIHCFPNSYAEDHAIKNEVAFEFIEQCNESNLSADAEAQFDMGEEFYSKRDFSTALYWYTKAAARGHLIAMSALGLCYNNGEGVPQDYHKAVYWYTKAAEQGRANAQCNLGSCYYNGQGATQDYNKAVYWYTKAAEQENARAQFNLGICYYNGHGVPQDYSKAVDWYTKAAEQGHAGAQYSLGDCYDDGEGVEQDYSKALFWLTKAAEQGYANASNNIGHLHYNGNGVVQDFSQAIYWFKKAAEQGHVGKQYYLGKIYYNGEGVEQDFNQAVYWFKKAAEQDDEKSQCYLGWCYYYGEGVTQDYEQAIYWYTRPLKKQSSEFKIPK